MSVPKEQLIFKKGEMAIVDYSSELDRKSKLSKMQSSRQGRIAIILKIIPKEQIGDWEEVKYLYRYKILVAQEVIEIDQSCLKPMG